MFQTYRNLFAWIELQKKPIPIIIFIIVLVAAVNIIGTLLMMVMEKTKDIGILRTMGASKRIIRSIFIGQGLFIGICGTFLGNALGLTLAWIEQRFSLISLPPGVYFMNHVPVDFAIVDIIGVSAVAIFLSLAVSYFPAWLASRLEPVRLIRFGS